MYYTIIICYCIYYYLLYYLLFYYYAAGHSHKSWLEKPVATLKKENKACQIHFDEILNNKQATYIRSKNRSSVTKSEKHQTVFAFGVRSLLTAFNVIFSYYPMTSNRENIVDILERNTQLTEELGLEVKTVVCGKNSALLRLFPNRVYANERKPIYKLHNYYHFLL